MSAPKIQRQCDEGPGRLSLMPQQARRATLDPTPAGPTSTEGDLVGTDGRHYCACPECGMEMAREWGCLDCAADDEPKGEA